MNRIKRITLTAVALVVVGGGMSACSSHFTEPDMIAIRYAGGPTEGGEFKECVEGGQKQIDNDTYYPYPTTQRQNLWDSTNNDADHDDLQLATKDGVPVGLRINLNFGLNTDCDVIRKFHEQIGKTRKAWFNDDGSYNGGWITTMNYYTSPALVARARETLSEYTMADLWPSTAALGEIQEAIQGETDSTDSIQAAVDHLTEGDEQFYDSLTVTIIEVVPDPGYRDQFLERQKAQTAADTAELNKTAQIKQAEADKAVRVAQAQASAAEKHQEILAYKLPGMTNKDAVQAYNEAQAISRGINPWQPNGTILTGAGQ